MCANPQSNWLNTIAVRASYILPILKRFPWWKPRKTGGGGLSPPGKNQNRHQFVFLSFGVDPVNWQSFIEIGEMTHSTTAWCSRGHAVDFLLVRQNLDFKISLEKDKCRESISLINNSFSQGCFHSIPILFPGVIQRNWPFRNWLGCQLNHWDQRYVMIGFCSSLASAFQAPLI